ncbi:hypothetical protein CY35_01G138300 [Sphagnum magellanicum]|nr:hypothetical protein CY35_01G138300 [Sphagnum magellanicum]
MTTGATKDERSSSGAAPVCDGGPDGVGGSAVARTPIAPTATTNMAPITTVLFNSCANAIATASVSKAQTPFKTPGSRRPMVVDTRAQDNNRVMSRILLGVAMIIL